VVSKLDRLARSTSNLYRIVSELTQRGVEFKVLDDPSIDTGSPAGKLVMCKPRGRTVRRSRKSCGAPSSARPVSIGHLGVQPKPQRVSEVQGPRLR